MRLPLLGRKALRFECTRCGDCCRRTGYVYLGSEEPARLAAHLGLELRQLEERFLQAHEDGSWMIVVDEAAGGCPLLAGDLCSVEEVKPGQCRAYPFWEELVGDRAAWRKEARFCEGIGRGEEIPKEEVMRRMALDPVP